MLQVDNLIEFPFQPGRDVEHLQIALSTRHIQRLTFQDHLAGKDIARAHQIGQIQAGHRRDALIGQFTGLHCARAASRHQNQVIQHHQVLRFNSGVVQVELVSPAFNCKLAGHQLNFNNLPPEGHRHPQTATVQINIPWGPTQLGRANGFDLTQLIAVGECKDVNTIGGRQIESSIRRHQVIDLARQRNGLLQNRIRGQRDIKVIKPVTAACEQAGPLRCQPCKAHRIQPTGCLEVIGLGTSTEFFADDFGTNRIRYIGQYQSSSLALQSLE